MAFTNTVSPDENKILSTFTGQSSLEETRRWADDVAVLLRQLNARRAFIIIDNTKAKVDFGTVIAAFRDRIPQRLHQEFSDASIAVVLVSNNVMMNLVSDLGRRLEAGGWEIHGTRSLDEADALIARMRPVSPI